MYKVPLHILEGVLRALEESNELLKGLVGTERSAEIYAAIAENEKQIRIIKLNFGFNHDNEG